MIEIRQRTLLESIKRLWPAYRSLEDAEMREAIRYLVEHPEAPCMIEGVVIPHGYGPVGNLCRDLFGF